jgi:hypothetical protein
MPNNRDSTPKDGQGFDAMSTYLPLDSLGINPLPDSEKYKRGIRTNQTGKARTIAMWQSCADCGFNEKAQEFIPNDYQYELTEEVERKQCPNPECKSTKFSVILAEKDTVYYPPPHLQTNNPSWSMVEETGCLTYCPLVHSNTIDYLEQPVDASLHLGRHQLVKPSLLRLSGTLLVPLVGSN